MGQTQGRLVQTNSLRCAIHSRKQETHRFEMFNEISLSFSKLVTFVGSNFPHYLGFGMTKISHLKTNLASAFEPKLEVGHPNLARASCNTHPSHLNSIEEQ